jgi:hypothetical protein
VVGTVLIIAVLAAGIARYSSFPPGAQAPAHFRTLPPGARLPSGVQCTRWVRESPSPETRPANKVFNHTVGQPVGPEFLPSGDSRQAEKLAQRINGDFTGTTEDILRWAACKWGIDQDIVFAQAAVESWWRQDQLGDWGTDSQFCPPGYGIGAMGIPGECPESYGILQNKFPLEVRAWPGIGMSTAMNADVAYAVWRACYDGYEMWLSSASGAQPYHAGDLWGCVGRWFAGDWYSGAAVHYIGKVREFLRERIWTRTHFMRTD